MPRVGFIADFRRGMFSCAHFRGSHSVLIHHMRYELAEGDAL